MSRREQPSRSTAERVRELNAQCMQALAKMRQCVEAAADEDAVSRLQDCFREFAGAVRAKLEAEERASLFDDLAVKKPRLAPRIETLHAGHLRLISELSDLESRVRGLADAGEETGPVRESVLAFVEDLTAHEEQEIEVLQTGFWREVGGSD